MQRDVHERDGRAVATTLHRVDDRVCQHTFLIVRTSVFRILPSLKWGAVSAQKKKISGPQRVTLNIPECDFLLLSFLSASIQGSMPVEKTFLTPRPTLSCFISVCVFFFFFVQSHMQRGINSVLYHILFLETLSFRTLL